MPTRVQYNNVIQCMAQRIQESRRHIMGSLKKMPVPNMAIYTDAWTAPVGKRGYIEASMTYIKNGKRKKMSLGIYEFQWLSFMDVMQEFEENEEQKMELSELSDLSQVNNSDKQENNYDEIEEYDELCEEFKQVQREYEQQDQDNQNLILEYLEQDITILASDHDNEIIEDLAELNDTQPNAEEEEEATSEQNAIRKWYKNVNTETFKKKNVSMLEFVNMYGNNINIVIWKKSAVLIAAGMRSILNSIGYNSFAAEHSELLRTTMVTDGGMFLLGVFIYIYINM